jgi:membrane protease YdiL (CAAX protease family)
MVAPALGVLAASRTSSIHLGIEWNRLPWRWLSVALLTLPLAIHTVALPVVVVLEGRLPWVRWLTPQSDGLYHVSENWGWGTLSAPALAGRIAWNALLGLIVVSALAFFEELGWRAFMLPRLVSGLGARRGAAASALICALWHVPFAVSGVQHVQNLSPLALALVSPLGQFGAALFLAFLWLKTGSIALVSLSHGALNNWGQYAFKFINTAGPHDLELFALVNLALLAVGIGALALIPPGGAGDRLLSPAIP